MVNVQDSLGNVNFGDVSLCICIPVIARIFVEFDKGLVY